MLLDRLAAQELMLLQRPVISGHYSGSPFVNVLSGPLDEALRPMFAQMAHIGSLVQSILSEDPDTGKGQLEGLDAALQNLEAQRYATRPLLPSSYVSNSGPNAMVHWLC